MNTMKKALAVGTAMVVIVLVVGMALNAVGPAFSATVSGWLTPLRMAQTGDPIPLKPIDGLSSLNATVNIDVNGKINGERAQGDLQAVLTTNDQKQSQITVTGPLLGEIAAQVGGSLVGLFTPSSVDIFKVPEGSYIVVNGLFPLCIKPKEGKGTAALDELSPQGLLTMLTSSDVARGKLVGDEKMNGTAVKHYVIDGKGFLAAAQKSKDEKLQAFAEGLWSAEDTDLFVDAKGGYPVAFRGAFSGAYEPLKFEGDFAVDVELTGVNQNTAIKLPNSCKKPITP